MRITLFVSLVITIWKSLMCLTMSESPLFVVLTGSMETGYWRGDLLLLTNFVDESLETGDVVVF